MNSWKTMNLKKPEQSLGERAHSSIASTQLYILIIFYSANLEFGKKKNGNHDMLRRKFISRNHQRRYKIRILKRNMFLI